MLAGTSSALTLLIVHDFEFISVSSFLKKGRRWIIEFRVIVLVLIYGLGNLMKVYAIGIEHDLIVQRLELGHVL